MTSFKNFFNHFHEEVRENEAVFLYFVGKNIIKNNSRLFIDKKTTIPDNIKKLADSFKRFELGRLSLSDIDKSRKIYRFTLRNSPFKTAKKLCSCNVVSGMLSGFIELKSGSYTGAIETKCISKGSKFCEFKVKITGNKNAD